MTPFIKFKPCGDERGSTLILALMMLVVLSLVGANVLYNVSSRYNTAVKNSGWQEALWAGETGADVGLANCRWMKNPGSNTPWQTGWTKLSGGSQVPVTSANDALNEFQNGRSLSYTLPTFTGSGEGPTTIWAKVVVDAPPAANTASPKGLVDAAGNQWYRIRSTGYAGLTGLSRVGDDILADPNARHKNALRKFSFKYDRYEAMFNSRLVALAKPQAQRTIEIIVQPKTPFEAAVIANSSFNGPGAAGDVDSYDSTDTSKSSSAQYDSSKRQQHGDVLVNTDAANFHIGGTIYGDVATNGGTISNTSNITGTVANDGYTYLPPVLAPTWISINATPTNVNSNTTITIPAGNNTAANPARYKLTSIDKTLTINPTGANSYAEIWVTGDISGAITLSQNAHVKIYFEGDISVKGRDIDNQNYNAGLAVGAGYLQLYGINPPTGVAQKIDIGSPGDYCAAIYAPAASYKMNGNPDVMGSVVVNNFSGNGNVSIHYDEALAGYGDVIDYRRASWVEDER